MGNKISALFDIIDSNPESFKGMDIVWFKGWLVENFSLYNAFCSYADKLRRYGKRKNYSARAIYQRLRWDSLFSDSSEEYKITNNSSSYVARLLMLSQPEFSGMFTLRSKKEIAS